MDSSGFLGCIVGAIVGAMICFFVGLNLGGNYFSDFVFYGLRGYEAVGLVGALIGVLFGALGGRLLARVCSKQKMRRTKKD